MKFLKQLILILLPLLGWGQEMTGEYEAVYDNSNSYISYNLVLGANGRFNFHFYRKNDCDICVEENQFGQGSWESSGRKLILTADPEKDLDDKFMLNLHDSKAHYIAKNPRDRTDKVALIRLRFYQSRIFWVKGMELFKK